MKTRTSILSLALVLTAGIPGIACIKSQEDTKTSKQEVEEVAGVDILKFNADSIPVFGNAKLSLSKTDTVAKAGNDDLDVRYTTLTEHDYKVVAEELGVEVAAIKAVVRIEAGATLEGFFAPGVPVINFDRSMYNKARPTSTVKAPASAQVPAGIKSAYGRKEWSQLIAARKVNLEKANMGTFWGMFQIGGFNYKLCGCKSVQEFVDKMSESEFEQLQLFANFIKNAGMLTDLKNKNWAGFARKYNGSSYKARAYHTRMAKAYATYKAQEK